MLHFKIRNLNIQYKETYTSNSEESVFHAYASCWLFNLKYTSTDTVEPKRMINTLGEDFFLFSKVFPLQSFLNGLQMLT